MHFPSRRKSDLLHNTIVNIIDGGFFGFGLGFSSFTTFLPLFLSKFTSSPLLFSLIPAIHGLGWQLPQLFSVSRINKATRYKPVVLKMSLHERLPFVGFALLALLLTKYSSTIGIIMFFVLFVWQSVGAGFAANPWQNMISKVIPSSSLGAFFGFQSSASNLLASVGSIAAGYILSTHDASQGFFICFALTVICMSISFLFLSLTKEREHTLHPDPNGHVSLRDQIRNVLSTNKDFVRFFVSRSVYQIATMGSAFYIVYWVNTVTILNEKTAGIITGVLTASQMIAAPAFGWLADRWGHRKIYILGAAFAVISSMMAILSSNLNGLVTPELSAFLAMILIGFSLSIFWTVGLSYSLSFGNEQEKPLYIGIINTLGAPIAIIVPILGGVVASKSNYPTTFFLSAIAGVIAIIVLVLSKSQDRQPA